MALQPEAASEGLTSKATAGRKPSFTEGASGWGVSEGLEQWSCLKSIIQEMGAELQCISNYVKACCHFLVLLKFQQNEDAKSIATFDGTWLVIAKSKNIWEGKRTATLIMLWLRPFTYMISFHQLEVNGWENRDRKLIHSWPIVYLELDRHRTRSAMMAPPDKVAVKSQTSHCWLLECFGKWWQSLWPGSLGQSRWSGWCPAPPPRREQRDLFKKRAH